MLIHWLSFMALISKEKFVLFCYRIARHVKSSLQIPDEVIIYAG